MSIAKERDSKRRVRWVDTNIVFDSLYDNETGALSVYDDKHWVRIRRDLARELEGVKLSSIPVFNSGALIARVEAVAAYTNSPQVKRAEKVIRLGVLSKGERLAPAFTTYSKTDARVVQRFYREAEIQCWCAFYLFCERALLQTETAAQISGLSEPLQGLMLYHLWINADLTINRESPPERYVWNSPKSAR